MRGRRIRSLPARPRAGRGTERGARAALIILACALIVGYPKPGNPKPGAWPAARAYSAAGLIVLAVGLGV